MATFLAFIGVSIIVIVTPGPDTAITIRNTLMGGRAGGVSTAAGIATGQTIWALATSAGVVALLVASEPLFLAVKYAGAAYLVFLGLQALKTALRPAAKSSSGHGGLRPARRLTPAALPPRRHQRPRQPEDGRLLRQPLPQFVPAGAATFTALLFLGLVFAVMTFSWLTIYAAAIAKAGDFLRRSSIRRAIEGATGVVLVALGLRLAAEQR
jgi:threonine/homoserine/homoserine lactone efflux protein